MPEPTPAPCINVNAYNRWKNTKCNGASAILRGAYNVQTSYTCQLDCDAIRNCEGYEFVRRNRKKSDGSCTLYSGLPGKGVKSNKANCNKVVQKKCQATATATPTAAPTATPTGTPTAAPPNPTLATACTHTYSRWKNRKCRGGTILKAAYSSRTGHTCSLDCNAYGRKCEGYQFVKNRNNGLCKLYSAPPSKGVQERTANCNIVVTSNCDARLRK
jgi:hypothetical protein